MNHCIRLLLLFTPSLVALGLLGIAFATNWWTIALVKNIPNDKALSLSADERFHSVLVRIPVSRGLLSECFEYRNVKILVGDFDFRTGLTRQENRSLANETCSSSQFLCTTGVAIGRHPLTRCIEDYDKCNRILNCEDQSDEKSCQESSPNYDREFFNCPTDYAKCQDKKSCYRINEQTCDGISNCFDKSDEKNCNEEKCQRNRRIFCQREGKCARRENAQRCDGIVDCEDNSDEENCQVCHDRTLIQCDSKCLPDKYRCDGIVHCSDLRDETNCGNHTVNRYFHPKILPNGRLCMEQRFNPFQLHPKKIDLATLDAYTNPEKRVEYLNFIFYLQLSTTYGIAAGLIFLLLAIFSLFFFGCCRQHCISVPFYFYGFWMLFAWLVITIGLLSFVFIWIWQKHTILDPEKSLLVDIDIHERNPTLRHIEFFGLSFWLACGAALSTFIGLLLSYCVCCTLGSSRADDKEYEIMHMHSY